MRNTYLAVGIIVVVLVIIAFAVVRSRFPQFGQLGKTNPTPTPMVENIASDSASIAVSKHTPASTVVVDSATLTAPGFIAISDEQNGQAGSILGTSDLLSTGSVQNVTIPLSRKTVSGETLLVQIYKDNGDGAFNAASDELVKDGNSNTVKGEIPVSSEASGFQIPATGLGQDSEY